MKNKSEKIRFEEVIATANRIPEIWKKIIIDEYINSAIKLREKGITDLIVHAKKWNWTYNKVQIWNLFHVFVSLNGAGSVLQLADEFVSLYYDSYDDVNFESLKSQTRRDLRYLKSVNLVHMHILSTEKLGKGKHAVTIYYTDFAKEEDIAHAADFYINMGGSEEEFKKPKSSEYVHKINFKRRIKAILAHERVEFSNKIFLKCPNNHKEGYRCENKPNYNKPLILYCKKCGSRLKTISIDDYIERRGRELRALYDI